MRKIKFLFPILFFLAIAANTAYAQFCTGSVNPSSFAPTPYPQTNTDEYGEAINFVGFFNTVANAESAAAAAAGGTAAGLETMACGDGNYQCYLYCEASNYQTCGWNVSFR